LGKKIYKRKNKKGGKLRKYLHHIIIEEFGFYIDDDFHLISSNFHPLSNHINNNT